MILIWLAIALAAAVGWSAGFDVGRSEGRFESPPRLGAADIATLRKRAIEQWNDEVALQRAKRAHRPGAA